MSRYKVIVPAIPSMGKIRPFIVTETGIESKEDHALYQLNCIRKRDGLSEWEGCPVKLNYVWLGD